MYAEAKKVARSLKVEIVAQFDSTLESCSGNADYLVRRTPSVEYPSGLLMI